MKHITIAEEDGERLERLARFLHDHGYVLVETDDSRSVYAPAVGTVTPESRHGPLVSSCRPEVMLEDAPAGICRFTPDGNIIAVSAAAARIFGYDSQQELIAAINKGVAGELNAESGEVRWVDGRMVAEKVILLKEIHHRVKNNLQVISSLLDLQVEMVHDGLMRKYFQDCQDRIRSMALVHEKLYQSRDFSAVDFSGYIDELVRHLHRAYAPDRSLIDLEVDAGAISLSIDQAIPCGLIVNELVSNALKHAFHRQRSGKVRVGFRIGEIGAGMSQRE